MAPSSLTNLSENEQPDNQNNLSLNAKNTNIVHEKTHRVPRSNSPWKKFFDRAKEASNGAALRVLNSLK